jgi:hypothetical protein
LGALVGASLKRVLLLGRLAGYSTGGLVGGWG